MHLLRHRQTQQIGSDTITLALKVIALQLFQINEFIALVVGNTNPMPPVAYIMESLPKWKRVYPTVETKPISTIYQPAEPPAPPYVPPVLPPDPPNYVYPRTDPDKATK